MATYGQYYYDGLDFLTCTNIYTDAALTIVAADGWYSQGGNFREMVNSVLLAAQPCSDCSIPCGAVITASGNTGIYKATFSFGTQTGAAVINFNAGNNSNPVPDKLTWTFDGVSASEYSSLLGGYLQGYIGGYGRAATDCLCCATCDVNLYGVDGLSQTLGSDGVSNPNQPVFVYQSGAFSASGALQNIPAWGGNSTGDQTLNDCSGPLPTIPFASYNATMVVPVPVGSTDTSVDIEISAPCSNTFFSFAVNCPTLLTGFTATAESGSIGVACLASKNTTIYHVGVNTLGNSVISPTIAATPDTEMGLHDWVFTDAYGVTQLPAGVYAINNIIGGLIKNQSIVVSTDGIITSIADCAACTNTIFISSFQTVCDTFCDGTNRTIPLQRETSTCDSYLDVGIGDVIAGAALGVGFYAYAATSTDTQTGPFRIMQITSGNNISALFECIGSSCQPL
tara:strand:+ start:9616 stop:10974 length:1359 start_codon:yes stop_codon:yes gene_type:complete